jgi:ABC-2 type transport system ATP-binding protein
MSAILEARDLVKDYPGVRAVRGISFSVRPGICYGLLGPNGAGKTTTVEIIEGVIPATSGEVLYKGKPAGRGFFNEAGIQFQNTALQDFLTVRETLKLFHDLYKRNADLDQIVRECSLQKLVDRDTRKLSGGQRQRLLLAVALVNDPEILFLDEPTTGLDPQARRNFWELVRNIKARGKTIILTTHYMDEAYVLCDEIAIMDVGVIVAAGPPDELLRSHYQEVILQIPDEDAPADIDDLPFRTARHNGSLEIYAQDVNAALAALNDKNVSLQNLRIRPFNLEDLFLDLTGKDLRK